MEILVTMINIDWLLVSFLTIEMRQRNPGCALSNVRDVALFILSGSSPVERPVLTYALLSQDR